jgi:hypothetical protein
MRVYKIEYREYEYRPGVFGDIDSRSGYCLTHSTQNHVMADCALEAVDLLRAGFRGRIEVASIEHICKVDTKK